LSAHRVVRLLVQPTSQPSPQGQQRILALMNMNVFVVEELEASVLVIASQTFDNDKLTGAHHIVSSMKTHQLSLVERRVCKRTKGEVDLLVSVVIVAYSTPCVLLPAKLTFRSYYFHIFAVRAVGESVSSREVCLH